MHPDRASVSRRWPALAIATVAGAACAPAWAASSEADFLSDLPTVTLATRLPQAQADAPGAVTVLDRDTIRRSGARDLVDLLRLVPGFFVSGWSGSHRIASYHASLDEYGTRMQVYIDGRSAYSTFFLGGASTAMTAIALDEVERVEVLRGANSSSFGTNAMFGVINVITRHAADTGGMAMRMAAGGNGILDGHARVGLALGDSHWRLSASSLGDHGFTQVPDTRRIDQFTLRGDVPLAAGELTLTAVAQRLRTFNGFPDDDVDKLHATREGGNTIAATWRRAQGDHSEWIVSASIADERFDDHWDYGIGPGFAVGADLGGWARRTDVEIQQIIAPTAAWRLVWGAGWRHEVVEAPPSFHDMRVTSTRSRVFAHAEWRPDAHWTLNLGGLAEHHDRSGTEFAPRLAANWHLSPTQTVRMAVTEAFRMPTLFEAQADQRFYEVTTKTFIARHYYQQSAPDAERVRSIELGYLGRWPAAGLWLDLRLFAERVRDLIVIVPNTAGPPDDSNITSANVGRLDNQGLEYAVRWVPSAGTELRWSHTMMDPTTPAGTLYDKYVPRYVASLAWMQALPGGFSLTASYGMVDTVSSRRIGARTVAATRQLDWRLAHPIRLGKVRGEAALTWQAANGEVPIYDPFRRYTVPSQLFATVAFET